MTITLGQPMPDADARAFFSDVLVQLGLQPTEWRISFFMEWERWENTGAHYNPLATTRTQEGVSGNWNRFQGSDGRWYSVKNYESWGVGVEATAKTLVNGYYPHVLAALQNESIDFRSSLSDNLRTWGTTGFASVILGGWSPGVHAPPQPDPVDDVHDRIRDIIAAEFPELLGDSPELMMIIEQFFKDHFRTYLDLAMNGDTVLEDGYDGWTDSEGNPLELIKDTHVLGTLGSIATGLHNQGEMQSDILRRVHALETRSDGSHRHEE